MAQWNKIREIQKKGVKNLWWRKKERMNKKTKEPTKVKKTEH